MSYEKIRSICIDEKNKKVFITGASNNVRPLNFTRWECSPLSKLLNENGKEAVEIAILKDYESGCFQEGSNKYSKALKVLFYVFKEEYKKFDWRNNWEESKKYLETEEGKQDLNNLLKKALNYKFSKEKYIISKRHYDGTKIYAKTCSTCAKWNYDKKDATKFDFKEEAEDKKKCFQNSENWEIIKIDKNLQEVLE